MSSKFSKQYQIPPEYPDILKDFAREVLRNQPSDIVEFAAKYFDCLANGLPADVQAHGSKGAEEADMPLEEVEHIIHDLFQKYDKDGSNYLDPHEFKALMDDLQQRLLFPKDEIYRFLSEADMNADGKIEYEEFIPLALQIIQGMYAKKRLEQHMSEVEQHAEDLLVHGMSREELTELICSMFSRMDRDGSGSLSHAEFISALTSMELGLTRREVNTIMFKVDQDQDGNISYREFVPYAFELLQKLTSLRLLETEAQDDELAQDLLDLMKAADTELTGVLNINDVRDLLHQAMLGLSRMQIYTVLSEAEVSADGMMSYAAFVPKAVGLIRSMLSFEKSVVHHAPNAGVDVEDSFFGLLDEYLAGYEMVSVDEFVSQLQRTGILSAHELQAARQYLQGYGDEVPVEEAKTRTWQLVKNMRRHTTDGK